MLQSFEIGFLQFARHYFQMAYDDGGARIGGMIPLAAVTIVLFALQFLRQGKNPIPGVFGMFFGILLWNYLTTPERIIGYIDRGFLALTTPDPARNPVPIFEPFFSFFVAPAQTRFVYEELFSLLLLVYAGSWVYWVYVDYKKTGMLFEKISLRDLFKRRHLRPTRSRTNELGSGDLAETEHMLRWTRPSEQPDLDTCLYVSDLRGSEGVVFKANKLIIPNQERNRHMLIVAKTGGGKTTRMMLPVLYNDCISPSRKCGESLRE